MDKIRHAVWVVKDKQIGVLGLAFKPNTDDIRFAPAIEVIGRLLAEGAHIGASDPQAMEKTRAVFPNIVCSRDPYQVVQDADALLLLTEWNEFRQLDWERVRRAIARPLVLDGRNMLDAARMRALGFEYHSFGRPD
jgi:UDPglucose 6-dehydrogenase